ncbi:hypothetical protein TNCV_2597521 [Trichonephila clavipes]|nr:hypothetical protein TNCV_2597521 [Trichonephila clavipes]
MFVSLPSGIVVSDEVDCGAVGSRLESRVRHGCLCCKPSLLCDVCFTLTSIGPQGHLGWDPWSRWLNCTTRTSYILSRRFSKLSRRFVDCSEVPCCLKGSGSAKKQSSNLSIEIVRETPLMLMSKYFAYRLIPGYGSSEGVCNEDWTEPALTNT